MSQGPYNLYSGKLFYYFNMFTFLFLSDLDPVIASFDVFQSCLASTWREISFFMEAEIFMQFFYISSCAQDCVQSCFKYLHVFYTPLLKNTNHCHTQRKCENMQGLLSLSIGGIAPRGIQDLSILLRIWSTSA